MDRNYIPASQVGSSALAGQVSAERPETVRDQLTRLGERLNSCDGFAQELKLRVQGPQPENKLGEALQDAMVPDDDLMSVIRNLYRLAARIDSNLSTINSLI